MPIVVSQRGRTRKLVCKNPACKSEALYPLQEAQSSVMVGIPKTLEGFVAGCSDCGKSSVFKFGVHTEVEYIE